MTSSDQIHHPLFAAVYQISSRLLERSEIGSRRADLVGRAHGRVLDLGAGTGLNLPHLGAAVTELHLVEPDAAMRRRLPAPLPTRTVLHDARAEALPLPDDSIDTALLTLTMCSVGDPAAAAGELLRVLRPGGQLLVLEHVAAPAPTAARLQRWLDRPWGAVAGGCRLTRDTAAVLATAGFDVRDLATVTVAAPPWIHHWLCGVATPA